MTSLLEDPRPLAALYRMVARLVAAGIPPIQCATALRDAPRGRTASAAAAAFIEAFTAGGLPSAALARTGAVPRTHVAVLGAGESMGRLDTMLDLLASWCEEQARIRALMLRLLAEPFVAWLVMAFILPLGTLISRGFGAWLFAALITLAVPIVVLLALGRLSARRGSVPGFDEVARLLAVARACRTLALMNAAGLPMPRSLREAADAAAHPEVTPSLQRVASSVERGAGLGESLRAAGTLRPVELALVADGEVTGRIDLAFRRAADLLEHEGFEKARWRVRIVGAVLFGLLAIYTALKLAGALGVAAGSAIDA